MEGIEVRPRRAAEAFWRCEQAFERRTRDMIFLPFSGECATMEGAFGAGFRGFGVERILIVAGWLALEWGAVVAGALKAES